MKYKLRMITRENANGHPVAKEYFDAEFGHVLIVEDENENWWYAETFLLDMYYEVKKSDFEMDII